MFYYTLTFENTFFFFLFFFSKGSTIANFTIEYLALDSEEFLFLQDSIEVDRAVGKIPVLFFANTSYAIGPDRELFNLSSAKHRSEIQILC